MKLSFKSLFCSLGLITIFSPISPSFALYSIGQNTSDDFADNLQGQGFTPNQIGPNGSGSAPTSGPVTLSAFTFAYDAGGARTPVETLYIYDFLPTPAEAAVGTGALYTNTSFSTLANDPNFGFPSRTFIFTNVLLEASQKYFAITPSEQSLRYIFSQNLYSGGAFVITNSPSLTETLSLADLAFRADLVAVPFEFSPVPGLIVGGILFSIYQFKRSKH